MENLERTVSVEAHCEVREGVVCCQHINGPRTNCSLCKYVTCCCWMSALWRLATITLTSAQCQEDQGEKNKSSVLSEQLR